MSTFPYADTVQLPAIDREALTRLERFGGIKLLHEMIALFLENARERLAAAADALDAGDAGATDAVVAEVMNSLVSQGAVERLHPKT